MALRGEMWCPVVTQCKRHLMPGVVKGKLQISVLNILQRAIWVSKYKLINHSKM